ncbi:MAG: hypothetical protein ACAH95_14830 [Fimbriimonas sp.]
MLIFLALALQLPMPDVQRDFILTPKQAYLMLAPDIVCGPTVTDLAWSVDGKMLAVRRVVDGSTPDTISKRFEGLETSLAKQTAEILLWNSQTKALKVAFSADASKVFVGKPSWMGKSGTAFVSVSVAADGEGTFDTSEGWLLRQSGNVRVSTSTVDTRVLSSISPTHDIGAVAAVSRNGSTIVRFFDSTARLGSPFEIKEAGHGIQWREGVACVPSYKQEGSRSRLLGWFDIDRRTGALTPGGAPPYVDTPQSQDMRIEHAPTQVRIGEGQSVRVTSLAATGNGDLKAIEVQSGLISGDGGQALIAPNNGAVAFTVQGVALVRALAPISREAFLKARAAAERTEIMSKAKQVSIAIAIYMSDHGDQYPPNAGFFDATLPYLKDRSMLGAFNYTFAGGQLPAGANPSRFPIGFYSGPGGRAIVYADTSVKWEKDP